MRAVVVRELGDASCLTLDEARTVPTLGAGEVLVRNSFAGLNFHDTYTRSGLYPMPRPADFVVGCEGGGVVAHCPAGVACGVKEGDRVVYLQVHLARKPNSLVVSSAHVQPNVWSLCLPACLQDGVHGTYAEYTPVAAGKLMPVPDALSLQVATRPQP